MYLDSIRTPQRIPINDNLIHISSQNRTSGDGKREKNTILTIFNRDIEIMKENHRDVCFNQYAFLRRLSETLKSRFDLEALKDFFA